MERPRDCKLDTKAIAEALGAAQDAASLRGTLAGVDLERLTANDYSLLSRALQARPASEALDGAGALLLSGHPVLEAELTPAILDELARRTGREARWEARPALAIEAPQAQLVPR